MKKKLCKFIQRILTPFCLLCVFNMHAQAQETGRFCLEMNLLYMHSLKNDPCESYFTIFKGHEFSYDEEELISFGRGEGYELGFHDIPNNLITKYFAPNAGLDYIGFFRGVVRSENCLYDDHDSQGYPLNYPHINDSYYNSSDGPFGGDIYRMNADLYIRDTLTVGSYGNPIFKGYETMIELIYQPAKIHIWYFDPDGRQVPDYEKKMLPLPDKDNITLKATKGFVSFIYNWQYSINGTEWKDFPSNIRYQNNNRNEISFKGTDLFPEDKFRDMLGKNNIFIRINTPTEEGIKEYVLYPAIAAPHITQIEYEKETCHGSADASVKVSLDRALYKEEKVYLARDGRIDQGQGLLEPDASNTVRIPGWKTGTYQLSLVASYKGRASYRHGPSYNKILSIEGRPPLKHSIASSKQVGCYQGSDGEIRIEASGGNLQYVGKLFEEGQEEAVQAVGFTYPGAGVFRGLKKGRYRVEIHDTNGCSAYAKDGSELAHAVEIREPLQAVDVQLEHAKPPLAFDSSDGEMTVRVSGGSPWPEGYTVAWQSEKGETFLPEASYRDGESVLYTAKGLHRGNYRVTAKDKNYSSLPTGDKALPCSCMGILSYSLESPALLEVSLEQAGPVLCKGSKEGKLAAHAKGGRRQAALLPYAYAWYRFAGNGRQKMQIPGDSIAKGLGAGKYQVEVTDANRISAFSEPFALSEPDSLKIRFESASIGCAGGKSGKIKALVSGGTPPYKYQWNREGEAGSEIRSLEAGTYFLRVTDKNGCQLSASAEVKAPGSLKVDTAVVQPSCAHPRGGAIGLKISGGSPPYQIRWKDSGNAGFLRKGLPPGDYLATVEDGKGCSTSYEFTLRKPKTFKVALEGGFTLCRGQKRSLKAVCEEPGASYEWQEGGKKLDASGSELLVDRAGTYRVRASNPEGCFAEDEVEIRMSRETLNLDFALPALTEENAEVHAVNISTVTAGSLAWHLPEEASILKQTATETVFSIGKKGSYTVSMEGSNGGCSTLVTRSIRVAAKGGANLPVGGRPLVKQFIAKPNPTRGYFKVLVELEREEGFSLLLYAPSGYLLDKKEMKKARSKIFEYEIKGSLKGAYLLHLQTPEGKSVLKIVVNR